jgi:putative glutamine amidotransferase
MDNIQYDNDRDDFELSVIALAISMKKPILGICRGLQMLNVFAGGTLYQDLPTVAPDIHASRFNKHKVTLSGVLRGLFDEEELEVNSLHHQAVNKLGSSCTIVAEHPNGCIEGLFNKRQRWLGVQWHPELLNNSDNVFQWLVNWGVKQ